MLPKKNRFTRAQFDQFAANPSLRTTYNKLGTLKFLPERSQKQRLFAVVTSSKHEKLAVARNKLRRRLYQRFGASPVPFSGILYASKQSYTLDLDELNALFDNLASYAAKSGK